MSSNLGTSKSFYDWVKKTDQFEEQIIFTIDTKSSFRSFFGVLFSFILMSIGIAMFIFMGQSFFFKINPSVTASSIKSVFPPVVDTSNDNKMFLAFKYRDSAYNVYPADGSVIYMSGFIYNPNAAAFRSYIRPLVLCNETAGLDMEYLKENDLLGSNTYCFPLSHEYFGGSSRDLNFTYFGVSISFCSPTFSGCDRTKILTVLDLPQQSTYIEFFYPEFFFDANNYNTPIVIKHSKLTDVYTGRSSIFRESYFKKSVLKEDNGAILEDNIENSYFTIGEQYSRSIYKSDPTDYTIAKYYFYMGSFTETYNRKYQKLQDVIAVVGGFLRICQVLLRICLINFVKYLRNIQIMNSIIDWTDDEHSSIPKNMIQNKSLDSKVKKALRLVVGSLDQHRTLISDTVNENKEISRSHTHIQFASVSNKNKEDSLNIDVNELSNLKLKEKRSKNKLVSKFEKSTKAVTDQDGKKDDVPVDIYKLKNEIFSTKPSNKNKLGFSLSTSELLKKMFCRSLLNKDQQVKVKIYDFAERYIKERLDVFGYLNLINEVNKMKMIFFNSQQINSFEHIENPTIPINSKNLSLENIENLKYLLPSRSDFVNQNDINVLSDYYARKIYEQSLTNADKVLLVSLTEDILREILSKLYEVKDKMKINKNIVFEDVNHSGDEVLNFG
jgi:hypothetical protein